MLSIVLILYNNDSYFQDINRNHRISFHIFWILFNVSTFRRHCSTLTQSVGIVQCYHIPLVLFDVLTFHLYCSMLSHSVGYYSMLLDIVGIVEWYHIPQALFNVINIKITKMHIPSISVLNMEESSIFDRIFPVYMLQIWMNYLYSSGNCY